MALPRSDGAGLWCASSSVLAEVWPGVLAPSFALPVAKPGCKKENRGQAVRSGR